MKRFLVAVLTGSAMIACGDDASGPSGDTGPYELVNAFPALTFSRPTDIQTAGDGTNRLFVTEQTGRILVFANRPDVASSSVFLDITPDVLYQTNSELGLLGLAFHPQYETNGYFFVYYTVDNPRRDRLSRFNVSGDPGVADRNSEKILLEFADDYANHNGGGMCFDADGYLYLGIGDEGGAGDPDNNAQDRSRPFGKILRIDVNQNVNQPPYHGIPAGNPYAGNASGYREDIWAYGFRNPWRISFDAPTGLLIAGDVGQRTWEEIDFVEKGVNYGWDCREGKSDYNEAENGSSPLCAGGGPFKQPVHVYGHNEGSSITGGYVYRGVPQPALRGRYIFGDFISGHIWALNVGSQTAALLTDSGRFISTFGVAEDGELIVGAYFGDGSPTGLYHLREK